MRPSSSSVALAETNAEDELLKRLDMETPRLRGHGSTPRGPTASAPVRVPSLTGMSESAMSKAGDGAAGRPRREEAAAAVTAAPALVLAATLLKQGVGNVEDDSFHRCFEETFPEPWNWNIYLFPAWLGGVLIRYLILFPARALALLLGHLLFFVALAGLKCMICLPGRVTVPIERWMIQMLCSVYVMSWSGVIKFHGARPVGKPGESPGVFVANHSSMIDFIVLQQSHNYSVVAQKHGGWIGFFQDVVLSAIDGIWFDRSDKENKGTVARLITEHARDPDRVPVLVFPEGTCVNNKHVIMFRKTVFDLGVPVNPVAIRYNDVFVPGYWNSRRISFAGHLMSLMTSWALVCDVWYLDPMTIREGETAIAFAKRVQRAIARRAGLKVSDWDGYMKYWSPSTRFIRERRSQCAAWLLVASGLRADEAEPDSSADGTPAVDRALSAPPVVSGASDPVPSVMSQIRRDAAEARRAEDEAVQRRAASSPGDEVVGLSLDE